MIKHEWNGTILTITSDSGTSSADLRGSVGNTGARGPRGLKGDRGGGAAIEDGIISSESTWSSAGIMDRFAEAMAAEGNPVSMRPLSGLPFTIGAHIESIHPGEGEPSPTNIRPLRRYDSIDITRSGKNMIDDSIRDFSLGEIYLGSTADTYICLPSGTYTFTVNTADGSKSNLYVRNMKTGEYIVKAYTKNQITFELYENTHIRLHAYSDTYTSAYDIENAQLEIGAQSTAYEPYNGETYSSALQAPICCGEIDVNRGIVEYNYKYLEFDGSENWTLYGSGDSIYFCLKLDNTNNVGKYQYCSHGIQRDSILSGNTHLGFYVYYSTTNKDTRVSLRLGADGVSTLETWKAYLAAQKAAGNPVSVMYELKEAETMEFEPLTIKAGNAEYSGINVLYSNADTMNVFGRVDTMFQLSMLSARVEALERQVYGWGDE